MISLGKPTFDEKEISAVEAVMESGWVAKGPTAAKFELDVENYLHINHAIAVTNCTSALHLALMALGIEKGDRVIVSDYTFPATGFAPRYVGADPICCDIDPKTYNMDPKKFEYFMKYKSYKIKAIIVVHAFGQCADMTKIMEIARRYTLPVIEDAACALGATFQGKQAGTWGDIGCFSLHGRKGITTGEGGIVVTNDNTLANRMRKLSEFGVMSTFQREGNFFSPLVFETLGYNYKMSDIQAAIGRVQLKKLPAIIKEKRRIAKEYTKLIYTHIPFLEPPEEDPRGEHIWQAYVPLVIPEVKHLRNRIIDMFLARGVQVTIGTYALHRQPYFGKQINIRWSGDVFDRAISLPIYPGVDYNKVINIAGDIWQDIVKGSRNLSDQCREGSSSQKNNGRFSGIEAIQERMHKIQQGKSLNTQR